MNPWLFILLIGLILFLLLIDWSTFYRNFWVGIVCAVHFLGIDILNTKLEYFRYLIVDNSFRKLFIFSNTINVFNIGVAFLMGILFTQFLPKNYFLQLIHASVWTIFFRLMFQIAEHNNMIQFIHWRVWMYFYIIPVNMLTLAWLKNIIFERDDKAKYENVDRNNT